MWITSLIDFLCSCSILITSSPHSPKATTSVAVAISFGFYLHSYKKCIILKKRFCVCSVIVCMCVYVCMFASMQKDVCRYMCPWVCICILRLVINVELVPHSLSNLFWRQDLFKITDLTVSNRLVGRPSVGIHLLSPHKLCHTWPCLAFTLVLGIWTLIFTLV